MVVNIIKYLVVIVCIIALSCSKKKEIKEVDTTKSSVFLFNIPELDLNIATSKNRDGTVDIIFDPKKDSYTISDSVDYIKTSITEVYVCVIFDPNNKDEIFIFDEGQVTDMNEFKYRLTRPKWSRYGTNMDTVFYEPQIKTEPPILKKPYIRLCISSATYSIDLFSQESGFKTIRKGDIYGGW